MRQSEIKTVIVDELGRIAPEADLTQLGDAADLREELDIDSMDFLNFVTGLHERLKIDIPEIDYPKLFTLGGAIEYVAEKLAIRP